MLAPQKDELPAVFVLLMLDKFLDAALIGPFQASVLAAVGDDVDDDGCRAVRLLAAL
jgi:hypothetical protein